MNTLKNKLLGFRKASPTVLRIGMALVFIWFGMSQLIDVNSWGFLYSAVRYEHHPL